MKVYKPHVNVGHSKKGHFIVSSLGRGR